MVLIPPGGRRGVESLIVHCNHQQHLCTYVCVVDCDRCGMNSLTTPFSSRPDFIFRRIADELILVPIRQRVGDLQSIYTLSPVAARIWEWLDGTNNIETIAQRLTEEFDVSTEVATTDVAEFLAELNRIGAAGPVTESQP
jgi:hypothetical protein